MTWALPSWPAGWPAICASGASRAGCRSTSCRPAAGVSRAALSQIETLKSNPSLSVLWKIAVGLGIPFSELLGDAGPR
jgi:transcriptional regulator with XRE-family HTH domain